MGKLLGVDLYCGAGGLSVGAEKAGIEVAFAVDNDRYALETYAHNFVNTSTILGDVKAIQLPQINRAGKELIVFGGPPCQGFSTSNQRTRSINNPTNWFFKDYLDVVGRLSPEWVVFENVKGLIETANGVFLQRVLLGLRELGYSVAHKVMNALDFGVPQHRERLFVVGWKSTQEFAFPDPSNERITVADALSDLPALDNGSSECWLEYPGSATSAYSKAIRSNGTGCSNNLVTRNSPRIVERYEHIPQGGNWSSIPLELMDNYRDCTRCHTGIYRRLELSKPSVVIGNFRKNMLVHPTQDRGLSVREAARIQSFPDDFVFKGSIGFQQQQVGNAVPPLLGESIFRKIVNSA